MKIVAIIQARMGSTRLPGKMLLNIAGKPTIQHVWERIRLSKMIDEIVLATGKDQDNDSLANWAEYNKVNFYRGSENDVLDRYYNAAKEAAADAVVRITGDCPLLDFQIVDKVVEEFQRGDYDYVSNTHPPTFPDGLDVEVFSFAALKKAWTEARLKSEREHVTPYLWKHPEKFKLKNVIHSPDLSDLRWTLDTKEDLEFIKLITEEAERLNDFKMNTILKIVSDHPQWGIINSKNKRNEGYAKSLQEERQS
ncbi:MAG: glycosyltransferase family protein [Candidatus Firestonebacteria bacterium]